MGPDLQDVRLATDVRAWLIYRSCVSAAWPWLVGGVLAIGVGLAIWATTFVLVPAGVVLISIGIMKWIRSRPAVA